jgi:hypothetical protein
MIPEEIKCLFDNNCAGYFSHRSLTGSVDSICCCFSVATLNFYSVSFANTVQCIVGTMIPETQISG